MTLLVLFLGIQQHARPQMRNRLWFAGWVCFYLSYVLWEFHLADPFLDHLRDAVRFDLLLLCQLMFVMSFVASAKRLWQVALLGSVIGIPAVMVFNAWEMTHIPLAGLVAAVVLWQAYGIYGVRSIELRALQVRRWLILCLCIVYGAAFVAHLVWGKNPDMQDWALAELLLCSAILYAADEQHHTALGIMGTAGFLVWAAFYLLDAGVELTLLRGWMHWVDVFWNVPKFFVAFSMVLQMSEDARIENEQLADRYRDLYEEFHLLYQEHPHPIWIYDPETGNLITANRAAESIYGYTATEFVGMPMAMLEVIEDAEFEEVDAIFPPLPVGRRSRHRRSDGKLIWVNVYERDIVFQGRPARVVLTRDITVQMMNGMELAHRANHDALTGLPNRHELDDRIDACLARCDREDRMAALLTIDVDHFKLINDTYGHRVGDECLKAVATRLQSRIRQVDTLARSGGEEFTAIIGALQNVEDAHKIAAMLLGLFTHPIELPDLKIYITISIGVALFPNDSSDRETLKQQSDEALYKAKRRGRNMAVFATPQREQPLLPEGAAELPVA
jgi:diguanylate cyclase (GGDEF)-like protein/PAS domain S-box-containing protein